MYLFSVSYTTSLASQSYLRGHIKCVGTFKIYLHNKFHASIFSGSLGSAMKRGARKFLRSRHVAILNFSDVVPS